MSVIYIYGHEVGRITRLIASLTAFVVLMTLFDYSYIYFKAILLTLVTSDVVMLFYDYNYGVKGYLVISGIAYGIMAFSVIRRVKWKEVGVLFLIVYFIIACFNVYSLNYVVEEVKYQFHDDLQAVLILVYGIVSIAFCYIIGCWHSGRATFSSAYYLYAIFSFVLSDVFYAMAMYYDIPLIYFIERMVYLVGLYFLIKFAYVSSERIKEKELMSP